MPFSRRLLSQGEQIVLEAHPNWSILLRRITLAVVVIAGCIAVVVSWSSAPLWIGYVLLGIGLLALAGVLAKLVAWRSTTLVITNVRVVYRTGVLRRFGREIPLNRVQDVTYRQSIVERILGAGSLTIESAGQSGQEPFPDIARPAMVQSLINSLMCGPSGQQRGPAAPPERDARRYPYSDTQGYDRPPSGHAGARDYSEPTARDYSEPTAQFERTRAQDEPVPHRHGRLSHRVVPGASTSAPGDGRDQAPGPEAPGARPIRWVAAPGRSLPENTDDYAGSSSEELARLIELNRLGVITDAELVAKRRELLGGQ